MSAIDTLTSWAIQRVAHARHAWLKAMSGADRALVSSFADGSAEQRWDQAEQERLAMATSWIFTAIRILSAEVSAAKLEVKRQVGEEQEPVVNHPAEVLLRNPNPFVDLRFMWQYTITWMQLRGNGYWFLAPEAGNPNAIAEIWPVPADRVVPIPDKVNVIRAYGYRTRTGQVKPINPKYIVHFRYPNPFSLLDGLAPLSAGRLPLETEQGTSSFQRDTYVTGRGVPHSVIMLDEDMSDRDFIATTTQIREDFEAERKVIIARGGDFRVQTVGLSQRDMDLINQRKFTRDELDIIFLGFALHGTVGGEELRQLDKMFKEKTVFPLHRLLAGQLSLQFLHPYYGDEYLAEFEDIRAQDRALKVQEMNVYGRWYSVDEGRKQLNMGPYADPDRMPGYGKLPTLLATNPTFVAQYYGFLPQPKAPPDEVRPTRTAALSESDAPVNQVSDAAKAVIEHTTGDYTAAEIDGFGVELNRLKKVAQKAVRQGKNPGLIEFASDVLPKTLYFRALGELYENHDVKSVIETLKADIRRKEHRAVNAYQRELEAILLEWSDEAAEKVLEDDSLLDELLLALLLLLIAAGRRRLPEAVSKAYGDEPQNPRAIEHLFVVMESNEAYLRDSFIPDLKAKIEKALADPDVQLAIQMGRGKAVVQAIIGTMSARIGMYAGSYWDVYEWTQAMLAQDQGQRIRWELEPTAEHCDTCLRFGGMEFDSLDALLAFTGGITPAHGTDCLTRCRCSLRPL